MYLEVRPNNLNPVLDSLWASDSGIELADGHWAPPCVTSDLILKLYESKFEVVLSGPIIQQKHFPWVKGARYFGLRFASGVGNLFAEASLKEMANESATIQNLPNVNLTQLAESLASQKSWHNQQKLLLQTFNQINLPAQQNHHVAHAIELIKNSNGQSRVRDIATQVNLSQRQLERLFLVQTGLSPKMFCRITRLNSLIDYLSSNPEQPLAKAASHFRFTDQSHLYQEFNSMMGQSISSYFESMRGTTVA